MACACSAAFLCFVMRGEDLRLVAPFICIIAVFATLRHWGNLAAMAGGVAASLTFEILLFPPVGSISMSAFEERLALLVLVWASVAMGLLTPSTHPEETSHTAYRPKLGPTESRNSGWSRYIEMSKEESGNKRKLTITD